MKKEWERFKKIKGCLLIGFYANNLDVHQNNKGLNLISVQPILEIEKSGSHEVRYWQIDWIENDEFDDLLILNEQLTPEPIEYELTPEAPYQKYVIMGSSFSFQQKEIKHVYGYGFKDDTTEFINSVVLELEELYISICAGAVIQTYVMEQKPHDLGQLIFSD